MEQFDSEELRDDMQEKLNKIVNQLVKENDTIQDLIESMHEEVIQLKGELDTCKTRLAHDARVTMREPLFIRNNLAKWKVEIDVL